MTFLNYDCITVLGRLHVISAMTTGGTNVSMCHRLESILSRKRQRQKFRTDKHKRSAGKPSYLPEQVHTLV